MRAGVEASDGSSCSARDDFVDEAGVPGAFGVFEVRFGECDGECERGARDVHGGAGEGLERRGERGRVGARADADEAHDTKAALRSEEHTSELQSLRHLVCRLLLEKKKKNKKKKNTYTKKTQERQHTDNKTQKVERNAPQR